MNGKILYSIDKILFGGLMPWIQPSHHDDIYVPLIDKVVSIDPPMDLLWSFKFGQPFNGMSRYYCKLIDRDKLKVLHDVNKMLTDKKINGAQREFLFKDLLQQLDFRIKYAGRILDSLRLGTWVLDVHNLSAMADSVMETNFFICQYLRLSLIQIWGELRSYFGNMSGTLMLMEGLPKIHNLHAFGIESAEAGHAVLDGPREGVAGSERLHYAKALEPAHFVAVMGDIRLQAEGIIPYGYIVKVPVKFAWVEEQFYKERIINAQYSFCGRHGCKNMLTAIYFLLIAKKYFKSVNDLTGQKITPIDIVRFLDHRYGVELETQFHLMKKEVEKRDRLIESKEWLRNLPSC
jgi:hypothetical protein